MKLSTTDLQNFLNSHEINFVNNYDLTKKSWIRSGGKIKIFIKLKNLYEIKKVLNFLKANQCNYYIIGNISNTLIRDGEIITPFINLSLFNKVKQLNNKNGLHFFAGSGVSIPVLSKYVTNKGYTGLEGLFGVPGTLGGGVFMNASSYGDSLTKNIHKIVSINSDEKIIVTKRKNANFSWRFSQFQENKNLIVGAYFFFPQEKKINKELSEYKLRQFLDIRRKSQEKNYPNLGSLFATKNIYSDLKFVSYSFFLLFILNKLVNFIFFKKIFKKYLSNMRTLINLLYLKNLKFDDKSSFTLSDKTINCLINRGSIKSSDGINLVRKFQKKINNKIKLENIILDKIL
jgi:UDP-N-acetylmuramate dehydrogenase